MRPHRMLPIFILFAACLRAQSSTPADAWIVDDFKAPEFASGWTVAAGKWSVEDENAVPIGAGELFGLVNSTVLMRTKPYLIDMNVKGAGGGAVFCLESKDRIASGHAVYFTGAAISTGYFDFDGKYIETRLVDYIMPSTPVRLRVSVDPVKRTYTITVQDRDVALEELRYISGYSGLFARKAGAKMDYFQVLGDGPLESPSFYLKSNKRQLDHISYMTMQDDAIFVVNPVIGMAQRLTSTGGFVREIPVQAQNAVLRGICVDEEKWIFVVDAGNNTLRIYNNEAQLERLVSTGLDDPRGVAAGKGTIYVLDKDGIKLFDKKGTALGTKCAGAFRNPHNITLANGKLYVADPGAGDVKIYGASDFALQETISENLVRPMDATVDEADGHLYVADAEAPAVFHYDNTGRFVERIDPVTIRGFVSPRAVRVSGGMIYVADFERILGFKKGTAYIRPTLRIE